MSNTISGLLTLKPTSPVPRCGEKHRYSLTERISKSGKPWTKVKAEGEGYGQLYEVLTVEKTDFVDSHGNVSFNIVLEPASGDGGIPAPAQPANAAVTRPGDQVAPGQTLTVIAGGGPNFWERYKSNFMASGDAHAALISAKDAEAMPTEAYWRIVQVAAISATIQDYRS